MRAPAASRTQAHAAHGIRAACAFATPLNQVSLGVCTRVARGRARCCARGHLITFFRRSTSVDVSGAKKVASRCAGCHLLKVRAQEWWKPVSRRAWAIEGCTTPSDRRDRCRAQRAVPFLRSAMRSTTGHDICADDACSLPLPLQGVPASRSGTGAGSRIRPHRLPRVLSSRSATDKDARGLTRCLRRPLDRQGVRRYGCFTRLPPPSAYSNMSVDGGCAVFEGHGIEIFAARVCLARMADHVRSRSTEAPKLIHSPAPDSARCRVAMAHPFAAPYRQWSRL
jgi:hypothetical protein